MCFHMFIVGLIVFATYFQGFAQDQSQMMMPVDQSQQPMEPAPIDQTQMAPVPVDLSQQVAPAPVDQSQQLAPAPVAPDMSAQQPPVAPAPDMTAGQPASVPGGTVQSEQLKWPDTIEVSEAQQGIGQAGVGVGQIFKDAEKRIQAASAMIQDLAKKRENLHTQFFELDARLDEFFQNTTFTLGKVQEAGGKGEGSAEMNQANELVSIIGQGKDALKNFLTSINDAIQETKTLVLQARQKSLEILKQGSDATAGTLKQAVDALIDQVTKRAQDMEGTIITPFGAQLAQINDQMAKIQPILSSLQAREFVAKAKEEQMAVAQQGKETAVTTKHTFQSWFIPEEEVVEKGFRKPGEEKTFIHYLFARLADLITEFLRILYNFLQSIKNWFFPKPKGLEIVGEMKKEPAVGDKKAQVVPAMPATPGQAPVMPTPQMPAPEQPATGQPAVPANV